MVIQIFYCTSLNTNIIENLSLKTNIYIYIYIQNTTKILDYYDHMLWIKMVIQIFYRTSLNTNIIENLSLKINIYIYIYIYIYDEVLVRDFSLM